MLMHDSPLWAEFQRVGTLEATPAQFFEQVTRLAAQLGDAPIAILTLTDHRGRHHTAQVGLDTAGAGGKVPELDFCARSPGAGPIWVEDVTEDPRYTAPDWDVSHPRIRFFARLPLRTAAGQELGALCLIDRHPRLLTVMQFDALQLLATQTVQQLELRRVADDLRRQTEQLEKTQATAHIGGWELDLVRRELRWTNEIYRIHEVTRATYTPTVESAIGFYTPASAAHVRAALEAAVAAGAPYDLELEIRSQCGRTRWVRVIGQREDLLGIPQRVYGVMQDVTERRQLEAEILRIAQREQQRIGFDLHDGLGQALTGVSLLLHHSTTRLPESLSVLRAELTQIQAMVRDAIGTCRSLAHGLTPVSRERGGLIHALRTLNGQLNTQLGAQQALCITLSVVGTEHALDDSVADHLYRIAQEAVTNAIRHAEAGEVSILIAFNPRYVRLSIIDNGIGMPTDPGPDGMGLRIMRYRARLIGATLTIDGAPAGGTRVHCDLRHAILPRSPPGSGTLSG